MSRGGAPTALPAGRDGTPRRIDLKLGYRCNNRCLFCVQGEKRAWCRERSADEVRAILAGWRGRADGVVLTGGEPTLVRHLPEYTAWARELGYESVQVQTNGRMLASPSFCRLLIDSGATEFSPALHGPTAAVHDSLTRTPGAFAETVRGILNLKAMGAYVLTNTVVTSQNQHLLEATAQLLVRLGVDQYQLAFVHPAGSALAAFDQVVPRLSDVWPRMAAALDVGLAAGVGCMTEAVPLCFLRGHEQYAAETRTPPTAVFDAGRVIEDYLGHRRSTAKAHGPPCVGCDLAASCEGPWREYPERFGWGEFVSRRFR